MSRHVQNPDSSIIERRLRPIYDWLDSGNNKKALQECEKVLKKNLNLQCGKALKALTLLRMGRDQECITILDNLTSEKPTDDATLQVISLCYREMEQIDKICKLYETAVKLDPTNEELHTHLFMSYVKIGDFKLQQQSAMALYKQKPKNPYYCWIVMSIILQATRGEGETDESKRKVLLSLAERMMTKLVDDNKMDAEQEVQLYILVLKLLEKYEEVLHLLDGPLGEKLQSANIIHLKLDYYLKLENWGKVNETCKFILNESFDRWAVWKHYIKSVFKLYTSNSNADTANSNLKSLDGLDNTPEKCHEFICGIIESGSDNAFLLRGPYLARFELCFKLQEHRFKCDDLLGDVLQLFVEYFRLFGHKPCCVLDLKIYLNLLSADQKSELGIRLMKEVGIGPTSVPQTADQMQLHIGALQLSRLCGAHRNLSKDHLQAMMTALVLHYQHGYQTYGKELPSTDIGPADNYALMAVHVMYDLSKTENGIQYLVAAIALLSNLIRNSPSNFHAKLLVVKIYHMLGDVIGANNIFYSLDIKHIQLDSLGYIHCGQLATTGMFSICSVHYDTTIKFFSSNYKDSTEHLTFCYKFGSFFKLDEFMDFRERMNNSLHYATVLVDRVMLNLMDCSSVTGLNNLYISISELRINWTKLRDNKDLGIYVTWDPEFAERPVDQTEEIQRLFEQDMKFLKLRVYVLYCIKGTIEVSKSLDGLKTASLEALKRTLKDWKELEEDARNSDLEPIPDHLIAYPPPSRLHGFLTVPYVSCITSFVEFFLALCKQNVEEIETFFEQAHREIKALNEKLDVKSGSSDFREKRKGNEFFVNNLEVICTVCVICLVCLESVKPPSTRKSKKKHQVTESKVQSLVIQLAHEVLSEINKFSEVLFSWTNTITEKELITILDSLNLSVNNDNLHRGFMDSYAVSYKEIQEVLKSKLKMLSSIVE